MDTLMPLQNLAVAVKGLKDSIDFQATRVSTIINENNESTSRYHSQFGQLLKKYTGFAAGYKFELETLHKELLNDIEQKQKEKERQERERQEKLESLSNKSTHSNLEIVENVEETEYNSSANSFNNIAHMTPRREEVTISDPESAQAITTNNNNALINNTASMQIPLPSSPKEMLAKKSVPIPTPNVTTKTNPAPKKNTNNNGNKSNKGSPKKKSSSNKKSTPSTNHKPVSSAPKSSKAAARQKSMPKSVAKSGPKSAQKPKSKAAAKTISQPEVVRTVTAEQEQKIAEEEEDRYVYRADQIKREAFDFDFNGGQQYKHSTLIYIGNIPKGITKSALHTFVSKKMNNLPLGLIEESNLREGFRGNQYALVRFSRIVKLNRITKFMNLVNSENAKIAEDKKKTKDVSFVAMKKSSKKGQNEEQEKKQTKKAPKTSWKHRVFIRFQDPQYHYSYYETEDDMYNDPTATHTLFIRNFDILDRHCHRELTDELLKFGDLVQDIEIKLDQFGDPYCIVIFKFLNDAIYCCNSDIMFKNKRLEIRYSKY